VTVGGDSMDFKTNGARIAVISVPTNPIKATRTTGSLRIFLFLDGIF